MKNVIEEKVCKLSVIVPCFNAEKTIKFTLESLEKQTYRGFQVIIVNDGSTDKSLEVIDEYKNNSELLIHVFSKKNAGVSSARNYAISKCNTEYITFLDADDEYHPDFLRIMYNSLVENGTDTCICQYKFSNGFGNFDNSVSYVKNLVIDKYEMLELYTHHGTNKVNFVNFIYKSSILKENNICFPQNIHYGEDTEFICKYIFHCASGAVFFRVPLYNYYCRENSATRSCNYQSIENIEAAKNVVNYWKNDNKINLQWEEYFVSRAIWAVAKKFALHNYSYLIKLKGDYDVKLAMRIMVKVGERIGIRISSAIYLVSPRLFKVCVCLVDRVG